MALTTRRIASTLCVCIACSVLFTTRAEQEPPPTPAPPAPGGGRGLEAQLAMGADFDPKPPVLRLTPDEQQARFLLPPGYRIEPVLHDPLIQSPVGVTFDGNGRMYVLEMRSYMRDADGSGSRAPISRISRHEDTNGDGTFDRSTVFLDGLVLPRIAFPLQDGVLLTLETDDRDMYKWSDTDGDGVADRKELFYRNVGRVTNMEWQPGGLTWALDNWLYTTYTPFRLRIAPDGSVRREDTEPNGGQWWSAQDDDGKVWWVDGGGEIGPVNFQAPIAYGAFNVPDNFEEGFRIPWPAPGGIADMQGGMARVRLPDGTLNHFTSASGVEIFRGHRLPPDIRGDLLFGEPVGRIVRRAEVVVSEGLTQLRNAHPKSEFIRSTDPLFRPVAVHNAPDGTLFVVDMYTGIIQDAQFIGPESYLRRKIEQYGLDKLHNLGRIWRVTHESFAPDRQQPAMYAASPAQLVAHLGHPNGWWRDTAQKLLVLRQDPSVVPQLTQMARAGAEPLARIHALWTLEGLGALTAPLARELMKAGDPKLRVQAIRASETLYKAGDRSLAADYRRMLGDADPGVVIQAMLTLNLQQIPEHEALIRRTAATAAARGVREIGSQLLRPTGTYQGQRPSLTDRGVSIFNLPRDQRRSYTRGEAIYQEVCAACHAADGTGAAMAGAAEGARLAPPLAGSNLVTGHRDYVIKVLLHGLTGPLGDREYPGGVMVPMGTNSDEWIADAATYVRNSFGNSAPFVTPEQVALVRRVSARKAMWTQPELVASLPRLLTDTQAWTISASHNAAAAPLASGAVAGSRWDTAGPQAPGMWIQVALPDTVPLTEIHLETIVPGARGARGGRGGRAGGRGAGPVAGPAAYEVQLSEDGRTWSAPAARGAGQTPLTVIAFPPARARYVRITQTGTAQGNEAWGIAALRLYRAGAVPAGR